MIRFLAFLYNFAKMFVATCIFVFICSLFGVFAVDSVLGVFALALALLVPTFALFALLITVTCKLVFKVRKPGILRFSVCATAAGALAIAIGAWWAPAIVVLAGVSGFLLPIPLAAANVCLIWLVGWLSGSLRDDLTWLSQR